MEEANTQYLSLQIQTPPQRHNKKESISAWENDSVKDAQSKQRSIVIKEFIESTTLHGLSRIFVSRTKVKKFCWLLLVLAGLIYVTISSYETISRYYEYPFNTKVKMVFEKESVFPAVTICNTNKFMRSKALRKYPELVDYYEHKISASKLNISSEEMEQLYWEVGHFLRNTMKKCKWSLKLCLPRNFTVHIGQQMGLCYTFNSGKLNNTLLKVPSAGKEYGLLLELDVQQDQYLDALYTGSGFKIHLHDQDEPPDAASFGLALSPGTSTLISVEKTRVKNLPLPYDTACETREIPGYKIYTKAACIEYCLYKYIVKSCGCKEPGMIGEGKLCNFREHQCAVRAKRKFRRYESGRCDCPEPCETLQYKGSVSHTMWPGKAVAKTRSFQRIYRKKLMTDQEYESFLRENLVRVAIFYETMNYQFIEQQPALSFNDLLSSVGGLVGLFLGGSLLTIFEFFDFFLDMVFSFRIKRRTGILRKI